MVTDIKKLNICNYVWFNKLTELTLENCILSADADGKNPFVMRRRGALL